MKVDISMPGTCLGRFISSTVCPIQLILYSTLHSLRNTAYSVLKRATSPVGLEPTASGLEVRRAIHCATGTAKLAAILTLYQI